MRGHLWVRKTKWRFQSDNGGYRYRLGVALAGDIRPEILIAIQGQSKEACRGTRTTEHPGKKRTQRRLQNICFGGFEVTMRSCREPDGDWSIRVEIETNKSVIAGSTSKKLSWTRSSKSGVRLSWSAQRERRTTGVDVSGGKLRLGGA